MGEVAASGARELLSGLRKCSVVLATDDGLAVLVDLAEKGCRRCGRFLLGWRVPWLRGRTRARLVGVSMVSPFATCTDGPQVAGDADIGAVLFGIDNGDVIDFFMSFGWDDNGGI